MKLLIPWDCLHSQASVHLGARSGAGALLDDPSTGGVSGTGALPSALWTGVVSGAGALPVTFWTGGVSYAGTLPGTLGTGGVSPAPFAGDSSPSLGHPLQSSGLVYWKEKNSQETQIFPKHKTTVS